MSEIDVQIKEVKASLKEVTDNLKRFHDDTQKEIKANGEQSSELKLSIDEYLAKQVELSGNLKELEQTVAKLDGQNFGGGSKPVTLGQRFVNDERFKSKDPKTLQQQPGSIGFLIDTPYNAITSDSASAGPLIDPMRRQELVTLPERTMTIRDLIPTIPVQTGSVEYMKEKVFTNNAAPVSENPSGLKPMSEITYELVSQSIATVAHRVRTSNQILADVPRLAAWIDRKMRYGYRLKEEAQLLSGSGTGLNISGLITEATSYSAPAVTVSNETVIDRIRLAMLQVVISEYMADGVVLNHLDWGNMELTKDSQYRYIMANPFNLATPRLWGLPVVATNSMTADEFLVGAFGMGATIYDREQMNVAISTEDGDNFSQNMVTIRVEGRLQLAVERAQAFVYGSFNDLTSS